MPQFFSSRAAPPTSRIGEFHLRTVTVPANLGSPPGRSGLGHDLATCQWLGSMVLAMIDQKLPGKSLRILGQSFHFLHPVAPEEALTLLVTLVADHAEQQLIVLDVRCHTGAGQDVLTGSLTITRD